MSELDDAFNCVKSGLASLDTAIALLEKYQGPDRSLMDGYTGAASMKHIRAAMVDATKAKELLGSTLQQRRREVA